MVDVAKIAAAGGTVVDLVGRLAVFGGKALPVVRFIADWSPVPVPFLNPVLSALEIAQPWLNKITAGAPIVERAITEGVPIALALQEHGPGVLQAFREIFAIAVNADPARPEENMTAADVTDAEVVAFATASYRFAGKALFGARWTDEEYQRAWDRQGSGTQS